MSVNTLWTFINYYQVLKLLPLHYCQEWKVNFHREVGINIDLDSRSTDLCLSGIVSFSKI